MCLHVCLMCEHMRTSENNYKELILACYLYMVSEDQIQVSSFVQQAPFLTELPLWPRTSVLKIKKKSVDGQWRWLPIISGLDNTGPRLRNALGGH